MGTGDFQKSPVPICNYPHFHIQEKKDVENNVDRGEREGNGSMSEIRKRMIFHGRVQGVGFRYTAKYLARSLGLTGWVENEYDGTVILEVQGREALIYKLMEGLNRNQFITIDWIDTEEIPVEKEQSFYVK